MKKLYLICITITVFAFFVSFRVAESFAEIDAKALFEKHCKLCHGDDGKGKTFLGEGLGARDFTDSKWEATITDEQMMKQINEGSQNLKPGEDKRMFGFGDKLTQEEIKALIPFVRAFSKKK
ncbi:MAG TPA: c-type cytochrome [Candidatus Brocadiia bacterium]|nr:c-type cytochrome [Planctomycetota bacterium]MDO8093524.1 c-type cytochrome [Candidatus Brocadiales bacterium]